MDKVYLWFNAAIYLGFAGFCTIHGRDAARKQGYLDLDANGHIEYLVVYGGMELAFAAFYAIAAMKDEYRRSALLFSVLMYSALVAYRVPTVLMYGPVSGTTKVIACLEAALCVWAWFLWMRPSAN